MIDFSIIAAGNKDGLLTLIFVVRALTYLLNICFMLTHMSHFESVFSQIDSDIMAASMKGQYYGSTDKLLHQLRQKIRRRIRSSTFLTDIQVVLQEIIDEYHSNLTSSSRWTSEAITPTVSLLKNWVVTPADHFPSQAHVLCPALFSRLLHSTFCTGEVFVPCRQPAAAFHDTSTNPASI